MNIFAYLILGLIAGAIAKLILPGKQGGGWVATMVTGVVGAIVGGAIGNWLFNSWSMDSFWSIKSWIMAIVGSLIVLVIYGFVAGKSKDN